MMSECKVHVVDDSIEVRDAISLLMQTVGLKVQVYSTAQEFIDNCPSKPRGCIVLDVRMPGMSGLDLQKKLFKNNSCPPIIIISGHGDITMAVKAVKDGAFDFIEKPFNEQILLDSVHRAIELDAKKSGESSRLQEILERIKRLTPREKDVLHQVVKGNRNKIIADTLSISISTVEVHRARVMEKMLAKSLSDLMRMIILTE